MTQKDYEKEKIKNERPRHVFPPSIPMIPCRGLSPGLTMSLLATNGTLNAERQSSMH
jgi:hypothetical protein